MSNRAVLFTALAATLALTAWLATRPDEGVVPAAPVAVRSRPAVEAPSPPIRQQARTAWPPAEPAALAAWSAPAPPPPPPAASASSRPAAPPFPYKWIGRLDDGESAQALLSGPQRSFGARAGEVLDGRWRIERIAATRLELTWLPGGDPVAVELR